MMEHLIPAIVFIFLSPLHTSVWIISQRFTSLPSPLHDEADGWNVPRLIIGSTQTRGGAVAHVGSRLVLLRISTINRSVFFVFVLDKLNERHNRSSIALLNTDQIKCVLTVFIGTRQLPYVLYIYTLLSLDSRNLLSDGLRRLYLQTVCFLSPLPCLFSFFVISEMNTSCVSGVISCLWEQGLDVTGSQPMHL